MRDVLQISSNSNNCRCENEAFVRDVLQIPTLADVKTKLSCEHAFKFWKFKMWKSSLNWQFHCGADPSMIPVEPNVFRNRPPDKLPHTSSETRFVLQNTAFRASAISQKRVSCKRSFKFQEVRMCKRSFPARGPSHSNSCRCENEAFVRDVLQIPRGESEDVKTKFSWCETKLSC